jgi:PAS domain S-box-containing protein
MDQRPKAADSFGSSLLVAFLVTTAATLVRFALDPVLGNLAPFVTYFLAVVILAWVRGAKPGFLAIVLSAIAGDYFFVPPRFGFGLDQREAILQTLLFVFVSGSIVAFSHVRLRQSQRIERLLEEVREREAELRTEIETRRVFEAAQSQLASIVTSSGDAIFSRDLEGYIVSWNEGAEHLFGYTEAEMMGKSFETLVPIEEREAANNRLQRVEQGETLRGIEVERLRKDGSRIDVALTISPIFDADRKVIGISAVARDISERRLTERALAESEAKFRAVAETASTAIYIHDGKAFVYVNPTAEQITGYSRDELYRMDIWKLVHPDFVELVKQRALARFQGLASPDRYEYKIRNRKGEDVWLDFGATVIDYAGKRCILANAFDVTARKQAEEALIRSEKLASAGRLAATIAHEINNPLEAVTNLLYLAKSDPAKAATYIEAAESELHRVAHITRQTLGFYRDGGTPHSVQIDKLVRDVLALYAKRIEMKSIEVHVRLEEKLEVTGSSGELRQVVSNLISNAIDALPPEGRLSLSAHGARHPRHSAEGVRLLVADNGTGIPADIRGKIFEAFFTTKRDVGTGLGLWVTRSLVEKHGGTIRMRTSTAPARHGTAFSVFFPQDHHGRRDEKAA